MPSITCEYAFHHQVPTEEAQAYADEQGLVLWETSAKSDLNVSTMFEDIAQRLPRAAAAAPQPESGIQLTSAPDRTKPKSMCCA